jgi:EAL domain-containing protein (putative c-di-GMP-specific phosphodiesterase class I)
MAVNISARQLAQPDFPHQVEQILQESGLDPACLALELTESTLMDNNELAGEMLDLLDKQTIQLHLDDFGTGYSSLGRLQHFPISTIKIDRSFVQGINPNGHQPEIVRAIILLGRELQLDVIAEGIEQEHQMALLNELGCTLGQGFYLGRPVVKNQLRCPQIDHVECPLFDNSICPLASFPNSLTFVSQHEP